jgi:hypothetical protein
VSSQGILRSRGISRRHHLSQFGHAANNEFTENSGREFKPCRAKFSDGTVDPGNFFFDLAKPVR